MRRFPLAILPLLLATTAAPASPPEAVQEALDILLAERPAESESLQDPCEASGETRVYKLPATEQLQRLMELLLDDPFAMPMEDKGVSVVLLAKPLPCGERLLTAEVELWDSLALQRRRGVTRAFHRFAEWFRQRDPAMWSLVFPDDGVARKARKKYRLSRFLKFRRGSPWLGMINGYGVVVFPLASNSISGATLTFKTERLISRKPGKSPRRVVSRHSGSSVALPGPNAPLADPGKIRSKLGIDR